MIPPFILELLDKEIVKKVLDILKDRRVLLGIALIASHYFVYYIASMNKGDTTIIEKVEKPVIEKKEVKNVKDCYYQPYPNNH